MTVCNLGEGGGRVRLNRVSVRKYRSIDHAADFLVGDFTVLLGPNNQGKSNLLRAAVLAMNIIEAWPNLPQALITNQAVPTPFFRAAGKALARPRAGRGPEYDRRLDYDWERDYPLYARGRRGASHSTVILLEFELDESEQMEFKQATGISTNQRLPIQVTIGKRDASLAILKQGKGSHNKRAREIASFVVERVTLLHIPAVRTGETAKAIAEEILASRRRSVLRSVEYEKLIKRIKELDRVAVEEVEGVLKETLTRFVPSTQSVSLQVRDLARSAILDDIQIDDGVSTSISMKGDGIQSLAALALTLEWTRSKSRSDGKLIVAVEEPESHLHPGAVHELRTVLQGIAETEQVIVTTHSQSLVNRAAINQNVIVSNRGARPAVSLGDLRETLGVRLSDALAATEVIVIVEGSHDEKVLPSLLIQRESSVEEWISDGRVVFESAGSGSKIYTRALSARTILTQPVVVFDGDEAGMRDVDRLQQDGVIDATCVIQIKRRGLKYAELEDIFLLNSYINAVEDSIGFTLSAKQRRTLDENRSGAWSERLISILDNAGVANSKDMTKRAKRAACDAILLAIEQGNQVVRADSEPILGRIIDVIRRQLH